eukprot:SAG25_NODE_205_length_11932_cov_40.485760_7_plen_81_part_00
MGGGGYVFLNTLSPPQLSRYARRVGRLLQDYGPGVVDTYGFADLALLSNYSSEAAIGGARSTAVALAGIGCVSRPFSPKQ